MVTIHVKLTKELLADGGLTARQWTLGENCEKARMLMPKITSCCIFITPSRLASELIKNEVLLHLRDWTDGGGWTDGLDRGWTGRSETIYDFLQKIYPTRPTCPTHAKLHL